MLIDPIWVLKHALWIAGASAMLAAASVRAYLGAPSAGWVLVANVGLMPIGLGLALTVDAAWLRVLWAGIAIGALVSSSMKVRSLVLEARLRRELQLAPAGSKFTDAA